MSVTLADKIRFVDAIMAAQDLSPSAKMIGYVLSLRFHNLRTGRCFPSYDSLAAAAGLKRRATAIAAIKELADAEWIVVERGGGRSRTNDIGLRFDRVETVRETAPFEKENGTERVPFDDETVRETAPFEAINGTQNRRKGTENVPDSLKNTPSPSETGEDDLSHGPGGPGFVDFWRAFPKRTRHGAARAAFEAVVASRKITPAELVAAAQRYAVERAGEEVRFAKNPVDWLNGEHWLDEPAPRRAPGGQSASSRRSNTDLALEIIERMSR